MSGGVDSTIAAYILKKAGHDVIGVNFVFVDNKPTLVGGDTLCPTTAPHCVETNIPDRLKEVSEKFNIKIITRDYRDEFKNKIIDSFVKDYESGITPNPCALCNGCMKFAKLLEVMKELGADMIATGHYANVVKLVKSKDNEIIEEDICDVNSLTDNKQTHSINDNVNVRYAIKKSKNMKKDQSYMLYRLSQEQLSHIIFPLGDMDKDEVRIIANNLNLTVANVKDSQDVCFIKDENYVEFIKEYELGKDYKEKIARGELDIKSIEKLPYLKKGEFIDKWGKVLGYHNGIVNYTIGQRKGLNIAFGERKFVVRIDKELNRVVLGNNNDLQGTEFKIYDVVFGGELEIENVKESKSDNENVEQEDLSNKVNDINKNCSDEKTYIAKLRYRHEGTPCKVSWNSDLTATCKLLSPVRAITNGQSAVFYDDKDNIMFGGRISL